MIIVYNVTYTDNSNGKIIINTAEQKIWDVPDIISISPNIFATIKKDIPIGFK